MTNKPFMVGLLSAGWLFPAYLTYTWFLSSLNPSNSFPFAEWSGYARAVMCIWLAAVIIAWSRLLSGGSGPGRPMRFYRPKTLRRVAPHEAARQLGIRASRRGRHR